LKTKKQKTEIMKNLSSLLGESLGIAVTDYKGLKMKEFNELRDKIRPGGARFMVIKNTLAKIASEGTPYEELLGNLDGPNALIFLSEDVSAILKSLFNFSKDHKVFKLRKGLIEDVPLDEAGLKAYSELPTEDEVRSMFVGVLQAPLSQMLGVLEAPARTLVGVVRAYEDKLGDEQAA